ncbi:hypothetical protein F4803DRAFT_419514 [Xylaria telfairii]|nr:hypothetical protein F4803DRAFT_419514 [Xylaria telfairii]
MYKRIITAIIALAHVLPSPQVSAQSCPPPTTFTLSEITYLRYEVSANVPTAPVNTTQLVFAITNAATGISTGCALQSVPRSDGAWPSGQATTCLERTITVGGKDYPVQTSARVDWDAWRLTVNQTWVCRER